MLINWFSLNAGCTSPTANQVAKLPPSGGRLNDPLCEMVAHGPKPARLIVVTTDAVGCIAEILGTIPPPHLGSDCSVVAVVTLRGGDNYGASPAPLNHGALKIDACSHFDVEHVRRIDLNAVLSHAHGVQR